MQAPRGHSYASLQWHMWSCNPTRSLSSLWTILNDTQDMNGYIFGTHEHPSNPTLLMSNRTPSFSATSSRRSRRDQIASQIPPNWRYDRRQRHTVVWQMRALFAQGQPRLRHARYSAKMSLAADWLRSVLTMQTCASSCLRELGSISAASFLRRPSPECMSRSRSLSTVSA